MTILGIGTDLVSIARIKKLSPKVLERIFTAQEIDECKQRIKWEERIAGRFAAKEAFSKCLGTGIAKGITWHDIQIFSNSEGQPEYQLSGQALELFKAKGATQALLSISHDADIATAFAIIQ